MCAVNQEFAFPEEPVRNGDEVAFFPPVSGGSDDYPEICRLAPEQHATEIQLHAFRSAETMASHPVLGPVYRIVTDLSLPHFGATLLVAGSESDPSRIAATFADRDFHMGWAELSLSLETISR